MRIGEDQASRGNLFHIIDYLEREFEPKVKRAVEEVVLPAVAAALEDWQKGHGKTIIGELDIVPLIVKAIKAYEEAHGGPGPVDPKDVGSANDFIHDAIKSALKPALQAIHSAQGAATAAVKSAEDAAIHTVQSTAADAVNDVEKAGQEVLSNIVDSAFARLARHALTKAVGVAEDLAPGNLGLAVGPLRVSVDPTKDLAALKAAAANPPHDRASLKHFVETLTSAVVGVEVSAELAAVVVSSESLSVGFSASWDTSTFVSRFDAIMNEIGF